jgi:chromosome segregation ATPase
MYEEKSKVGSMLATLLSELIEAKLEVRQIISKEKAVQARCTHLELELAGLRSQLRESFVGYHREASELDIELATALEAKEQLEQCVAELSAQIDELKLQNLKQQAQQRAPAVTDTEAKVREQSLQARIDQEQQRIASLQEQNELLNKQTTKLKEQNDTLLREVERLSHIEQNLRSLQRDHDDLHKIHAESQKQIDEMRQQLGASAIKPSSVAISHASTPASAANLQASVNTSAFDDNPRDYLLGMNIASKDSGMTVKSFAPGSVCAGILRSGDQLLSIDGRRIKDVKHLRQICRGVPGTIVSIKYTREPSDEVLEMQLLRASNAQGQPAFREYIPCTPRAPPPSSTAGGGDMDSKLKMLEKKWERQLEEVLQAKAQSQKDLSAAIKDMREAQQDAEKALNLLNNVQEELVQAKESEALARKDVTQARSELQAADAAVRRLQDDRELAAEEHQVLEQEKLALLSKMTLLQAKLNIAVKSSTGVSVAGDAEEASANEALEAGSQEVSKLMAEKDVLVEASKSKTREIDALQGKLFAAGARLQEETQRAHALEAQLQKATAERGAWEETFAAQENQIKRLLRLTGEQGAEADGAANERIEELEAQVKTLSEELQACNDLLEQEWIKTTEQAEVMASLAADVSQWQARYEELEARGIDKMFDRTSADPAQSSMAPEGAIAEVMEAQVQEQVTSALTGAMSRLATLEMDKKRLVSEVEQAKLDKDVLDKGLDEAMKELRQQSQQLSVARDLASEARDLAAQETLRAKSAERKLEQESQKLRAAQADLSRLSMSISQTDTSRASAANSVSAPARSTSNSPVNNPVTLF